MGPAYRMSSSWVITASMTLAASGCAIATKAEPYEPRVFALDVPADSSATPPGPAGGPRLSFGRVTAAAHLRKRIVVRKSPLEVATHPDRRWAEAPQEYVRRAVVSELFEERHLLRDYSGRAPVIDLELLAFEELRWRGVGRVRVAVAFAVRYEGRELDASVVTVEEDTASAAPEDVTRALSVALERAAHQLGERVVHSLPSGEATEAQTAGP